MMKKQMPEKELERLMKAFANRRRIAILRLLKTGEEASVGEIADEISLSFKATSKHLGILSMADIIDREQRSLQMFYRLSPRPSFSTRTLLSLL